MTLVKIFIRPAICLQCGHIQLQTDNELAQGSPGNCSNPYCQGDNIRWAGPAVRMEVPIEHKMNLIRADHRLRKQAREAIKKASVL